MICSQWAGCYLALDLRGSLACLEASVLSTLGLGETFLAHKKLGRLIRHMSSVIDLFLLKLSFICDAVPEE